MADPPPNKRPNIARQEDTGDEDEQVVGGTNIEGGGERPDGRGRPPHLYRALRINSVNDLPNNLRGRLDDALLTVCHKTNIGAGTVMRCRHGARGRRKKGSWLTDAGQAPLSVCLAALWPPR